MYFEFTRYNRPALLLMFLFCGVQSVHAAAVQLSGVLETEIGSAKAFDESKSSDIVQATVEIGIDAEISEWVSGHILALYEDDGGTELDIDEATITFGNEFLSPVSLTLGLQYVPFGFFETNMVSDPLTLEIAETADSAVTFTYDDAINFSVYIFNGDVIKQDNDPMNDETIGNFGVNLGYVFEGDNITIDVGVGYINNLGESNGLGDVINSTPNTPNDPGTDGIGVAKFVPGVASHFLMEWGAFTMILEHVFATDEFASQELLAGNPTKPSAMNVEFALAVSDDATLAIGVQQTVDLVGVGLPENRVLMGLSYGISDNTGIGIEILKDSDYRAKDFGSGHEASGFTIQVATEF